MDYDNDGILDFISGSYDPGDLYLFRGLGEGRYAKVQSILDKAGQPVVHHPEEFAKYTRMKEAGQADGEEAVMARVASFGSWVTPVDWDEDGDLDLLIGSFAGDLFLRVNEGSRETPLYDTKSIPVEADEKPLHVNGHAAPVVADWNHDGLWDLVVGSSDGAVGWFANTGTLGQPKFGPYQQLVSPSAERKFFEQFLGPDETPTHGARAQICVTDYNLDGRLDLIVGDYSDISELDKLSHAQKAEFAELTKLQNKIIARIWKLNDQMYKDEANQELKSQFEEAQKAYQTVDNKKKAFIKKSRRASFIWLFLRSDSSPGDKAAAGAPAGPATQPAGEKSRDAVSMSVKLEPIAGTDHRYELTVTLAIQPGWHLYSEVPADAAETITSVDLQLPAGVSAVGEWVRPRGVISLSDLAKSTYVGRAVFKRVLSIRQPSDNQPILVKVDYQACTDQFCLPPAVLRGTVAVPR